MMFDGDRHRTFEIYIGESTPWQLSSLSSLNDAIKRKKSAWCLRQTLRPYGKRSVQCESVALPDAQPMTHHHTLRHISAHDFTEGPARRAIAPTASPASWLHQAGVSTIKAPHSQ